MIVDMNEKKFENLEKLINVIVLIMSGAYIVYFMLTCTAIPVRLTGSQLSKIVYVLYLMCAFKLIKALKKKDFTAIVLFFSMTLATFFSYRASGNAYSFLTYLPPIKYDKVLSVYLFFIGLILLIAIFSSQVNIIINYIYGGSTSVRSSWGICYPTDYASIVFFFVMFLWTKKKKCSDWFMLIPAILSLFNAMFVAHSRTSTMCSVLLIVCIIVYNVVSYLKNKIDLTKFKKVCRILLMCAFPACALLTLILCVLYQMGIPYMETVNNLMSNRLNLTVSGVMNYGIHPFGSFFDLRGGGFGGADFNNGYNFIDNSYALIFIRYGWVYFLVMMSLWLFTMKKVLQNNNYKLAIVLALITFHCISEHHYIDPNFNLLLVMPFVNFKKEEEVSAKEKKAESIATGMTVGLCMAGLFVKLPSTLAYIRTFVAAAHLQYADNTTMYIVFPVLMMIVILLGCLLYIFKNTIVSFIVDRKVHFNKVTTLILTFGVLFYFIVPQYSDLVIMNEYNSYAEIMKSEKKVLQVVVNHKEGELYSMDVPQLYDNYFKGTFSSSLFQGEELATQKNTTMVTSIGLNSYILFNNGYQWMQISDQHAIYTNDEKVIQALNENGYVLETYYAMPTEENTNG